MEDLNGMAKSFPPLLISEDTGWIFVREVIENGCRASYYVHSTDLAPKVSLQYARILTYETVDLTT